MNKAVRRSDVKRMTLERLSTEFRRLRRRVEDLEDLRDLNEAIRRNDVFVALPVGQGDAFFLRRRDRTALIDGGRSACGLPGLFRQETRGKGVDILVCTHNDADHANGVLGYLDSSLPCKEIWLPGSWAEPVVRSLNEPERFAREIAEAVLNEPESLSLEAWAEKIGVPRGDENPGEPLLGEEVEDALSRVELPDGDSLDAALARLVLWRWPPIPTCEARVRLLLSCLDAGNRIRGIALRAWHRGIKIRWFKYDKNAGGGGKHGFLVPLNAREVTSIPRSRLTAEVLLSLTIINRESLVFLSPATDGPPVLFTSDSDLAFNQTIPWSAGMLITAPHHGSEDNANAYGCFKKEAPKQGLDVTWTWVRSDGRSKNRPGKSYMAARGQKFCTLCRAGIKQAVRLKGDDKGWQPAPNVESCNCM